MNALGRDVLVHSRVRGDIAKTTRLTHHYCNALIYEIYGALAVAAPVDPSV